MNGQATDGRQTKDGLRIQPHRTGFILTRVHENSVDSEFQLSITDVHELARLLPAISRQLTVTDPSTTGVTATIAAPVKGFRLGQEMRSNGILLELKDSLETRMVYSFDKAGAKLLAEQITEKLGRLEHSGGATNSSNPVEEALRWQAIANAPKDGSDILCASFDEKQGRWLFFVDRWRKYLSKTGGFMSPRKPSHWWPLPPPPKQEMQRLQQAAH
jgi:hypothetical protein